MIRFVLILLTFLVLGGCAGNLPETLFEKNSVSFISPAGWKIIGEKSINESGYYVFCQRKGFGSSGIFMLSWINGEMDLDIYIKNYKKEFEKNLLLRATNVQFTEPVTSFFNDIPCIISTYTSEVLGVKSHGEIYSFFSGSKTFMLVFQESVDESEKNKAGFEKIKKSINCLPDKGLSENLLMSINSLNF